jgi:hypothetical protein
MHAFSEDQKFQWQKQLPALREQIKSGDVDGATAAMTKMGMPAALQRFYIQQTLNPGPTKSNQRLFNQSATPEDRARLQFAPQ